MFVGFSEAETFLRNCRDAVIITHLSPDGDCIGSGFALKDILAELGIRSRVVCHDKFPKRYGFITDAGAGEDFEPETVIAVDVADTKLMGKYEEIYGGKVDFCIDHHESNKNYAGMTLLRPNAAAACEVIYDLAVYMGVRITKHCAMALYTGIATDSGCFRYDCTTPHTHIVAAELMRGHSDIPFAKINHAMFEIKSRGRMMLEARICDKIEEYLGGRITVIAVTLDDMREMNIKAEELEGFAPLTIQLETAEVGILLREREDGVFKCSFRSADEVNVSRICQTLGGGGHAKAAGCTASGEIGKVKAELIETVRKALDE